MFPLNFDKLVQATAFLLRREHSRSMNYMRLVKLVYIADRESLAERGHPIAGGSTCAMERGPVISELLDLIKGMHIRSPEWSGFFEREGYDLRLKGEPGNAALSRRDIGKLEEVACRYAALDEWDLVDLTHALPEWQRNDPGKSSKPIPLADILQAVNRTEDAAQIQEDARQQSLMLRLLEAR